MGRRGEKGLPLVEILVVLAIIGIVGSVAVLGLGGVARGANVQAEARRLAGSIQRAADDALVTDVAAALNWDSKGYSFVQWNPARRAWQGHRLPDLGGRHDLPGEMALSGEIKPGRVTVGEGRPLDLTLSGGSESWRVRFDGLTAAAVPVTNG